MADRLSPQERSVLMRKIKSKHTGPEILLREGLRCRGFRLLLHADALPGKPDILLPEHQMAIQVRGCFWHGHSCKDGHTPKTHKRYWSPKLAATKKRDARNDRRLRRMGWALIVVWECRCRNKPALAGELRRIERSISRKCKVKAMRNHVCEKTRRSVRATVGQASPAGSSLRSGRDRLSVYPLECRTHRETSPGCDLVLGPIC